MLRIVLLALPLIEIAGFVLVGRAIGVLAVLALVIAAAVLGVSLLRREGIEVARRLRAAGPDARLSGGAADTALRFVAAVLLIVPGFGTDVIALALLVPALRRRIIGRITAGLTDRMARQAPGRVVVVDADYVDVTPPDGPTPAPPPPSAPRH